MVLEALAAVGLVGNIIQLVDFSCKLFDTSVSVYHSQSGSSKDSRNLEDITRQLQILCEDLIRAGQNGRRPLSSLDNLANDCEAAASDLLAALQRVKAKKPKSKKSSIKAALATTWNERQINAMEKRLDSYRSQLLLQLQLLRWDDSAAIQEKEEVGREPKLDSEVKNILDSMSGQNNQLNANMGRQIADLKADIRTSIESLGRNLQQQQRQARSKGISQKKADIDLSNVAVSLIRSECVGVDIAVRLALLNTLPFEQMEFRHAKIRDAHQETCDWVFAQQFGGWLRSFKPVYWISGKPGSGKSTLMKYLVDHADTPTHLSQWSGACKLVIASYFFWINGTELQRSIEGLLRVLLYEILRQCPDLIEPTCPDEWKYTRTHIFQDEHSPKHSPSTWSQNSLLAAFKRISKLSPGSIKFCFFIDGLDEYSGELEDLIQTIQYLTQINVKLCIASRPWNVFEEVFGQNQDCKLYLQDLNRPDIQLYVRDKLEKRKDFKKLSANNTKAQEIIDEVVEKSQGVFLWVFLVVRSLIEGLRNRDRLSQLQQRLREFPSDLEEFFRHIFSSLDRNYRSQTAHVFQIALATSRPLSPLTYWFADEAEDDEDMALLMPVEPQSNEELATRMLDMQVRINGRCKGLLELTKLYPENYLNYRIDFLHRTVRDFFKTTEMQSLFMDWERKDFNPDFAICKASLAELKVLALIPWNEAPNIFLPMENFMSSAQRCEASVGASMVAYINGFETTIAEHAKTRPSQPESGVNPQYPYHILLCDDFMSYAIRSNLVLYVGARLAQMPPTQQQKENILEKDLTLDMIRTILPIGPPVELNRDMQRVLWNNLCRVEPPEFVNILTEICHRAYFNQYAFNSLYIQVLSEKLSGRDLKDALEMVHNAKRPPDIPRTRYLGQDRLRRSRNLIRRLWDRGDEAGA